ncbi:unnamed protein product, partial [Mesorhabditis spiculigera]
MGNKHSSQEEYSERYTDKSRPKLLSVKPRPPSSSNVHKVQNRLSHAAVAAGPRVHGPKGLPGTKLPKATKTPLKASKQQAKPVAVVRPKGSSTTTKSCHSSKLEERTPPSANDDSSLQVNQEATLKSSETAIPCDYENTEDRHNAFVKVKREGSPKSQYVTNMEATATAPYINRATSPYANDKDENRQSAESIGSSDSRSKSIDVKEATEPKEKDPDNSSRSKSLRSVSKKTTRPTTPPRKKMTPQNSGLKIGKKDAAGEDQESSRSMKIRKQVKAANAAHKDSKREKKRPPPLKPIQPVAPPPPIVRPSAQKFPKAEDRAKMRSLSNGNKRDSTTTPPKVELHRKNSAPIINKHGHQHPFYLRREAVLSISKDLDELEREWEKARDETVPHPDDCKAFYDPKNVSKNRYRDIPCLDRTRVKLRNWSTEYIHANYVSTKGHTQRFICTQGPTDHTMADFWHMVCQERSKLIVQLCDYFEAGKVKCGDYFPRELGQRLSYGPFVVACLEMSSFDSDDGVIHRQFKVTRIVGDRHLEHLVEHLHWSSWPDHGIPKIGNTAANLLDKITKSVSPVIVHCSAGIGRTGSIVALQLAIDQVEAGVPLDGLKDIIVSIRRQRAGGVQTEKQYLWVCRTLIDLWCDDTMNSHRQVTHFRADYDQRFALCHNRLQK